MFETYRNIDSGFFPLIDIIDIIDPRNTIIAWFDLSDQIIEQFRKIFRLIGVINNILAGIPNRGRR